MSRRPAQRSPRAFTLIEMVLSLSLVGIVMVALGSMLALTMQSMPQPSDRGSRLRATVFPTSIMTEELGSATRFLSISEREIVFTIADRTGDDAPETVTYSWTGAPGDPLLRSVNGGTPEALLESVETVAFAAETQNHTRVTKTPGSATSHTREVSVNTGSPNSIVAGLLSQKEAIRLDEGFFQPLRISHVPADAVYWSPQYVDVLLERNTVPGVVRLEVHTIENNRPSGVALASRVVQASDLGGEGWARINIPGTIRLSPDTNLGVLLICIQGDRSIRVRLFEQMVFSSESGVVTSSNGGASWSTGSTKRMGYRLRSAYVAEAKEVASTQTTVSSVTFSLNPTESDQTRISTRVALPAPVRLQP